MDQFKNSLFSLALFCCFVVIISGCAGTHNSKFSFNENYNVNEPVKGERCYDASVVLSVDLKRAKDISRKVIIAFDSKITEETETSVKAQRNRHIGVFVGSGGEELAVNLQEIESGKTFLTVTTKTGFVGGAGQKAWSCQIIDEIVKMAAKK